MSDRRDAVRQNCELCRTTNIMEGRAEMSYASNTTFLGPNRPILSTLPTRVLRNGLACSLLLRRGRLKRNEWNLDFVVHNLHLFIYIYISFWRSFCRNVVICFLLLLLTFAASVRQKRSAAKNLNPPFPPLRYLWECFAIIPALRSVVSSRI